MSDLRELYQELILDHSRNPRNRRALDGATHTADGFNPLCGDRITLYLEMRDGKVAQATFEGSGCAISTASASLLTQSVKGKTEEELDSLFGAMHDLLTGRGEGSESLGKLRVFSGVRDFPVRVKCATLAWHTLKAALEKAPAPVTTEDAES